jgi:hypothetical protein
MFPYHVSTGVVMLNKIAELVHTQGHCVLATCGGEGATCTPHASLMAYCAAADCTEFWLATPKDTKKFRNLAANPGASLLIDDRAGGGAEGRPGLALTVAVRSAPFASAAAQERARAALLARHPGLAGFLAGEGMALLRLKTESFQLLTGLSDVFFTSIFHRDGENA